MQVSGDYTYTGTAHQPSGGNAAVTLNGSTLTENTDYTLSYSDHTNAGTATSSTVPRAWRASSRKG